VDFFPFVMRFLCSLTCQSLQKCEDVSFPIFLLFSELFWRCNELNHSVVNDPIIGVQQPVYYTQNLDLMEGLDTLWDSFLFSPAPRKEVCGM
jgi:hypothetical protein